MPGVPLRKPSSDAFSQQTLVDWSPRLGDREWIQIYYLLAIVMVILGSVLCAEYVHHQEWAYIYDGDNSDFTDCQISLANEGKTCTIAFSFDKDVSGPLYVYYGLQNFYQNNRRYTKSVMKDMLLGSSEIDEDEASLYCYPLQYNGTRMLYPCGLQANTFFNDEFTVLDSSTVSNTDLDKDGISYVTEGLKFVQVDGFVSSSYTDGESCEDVLGSDIASSNNCKSYTDDSGTNYYYYYPDSDKYQFLYETFPQIDPLKGVTDENFIVWMRLASFPDFRKKIGKIDTDISAGETIEFHVVNNFDVTSFSGSKSLIITTSPTAEIHLRGFWVTSFFIGILLFMSGTNLMLKENLQIRDLVWPR